MSSASMSVCKGQRRKLCRSMSGWMGNGILAITEPSQHHFAKPCPSHRPTTFGLFVGAQHCFDSLHNCHIRIHDTISLHLVRICLKLLGLDDGIAALAVIVAVQPNGNVLVICDFILDQLFTCNLGDVERDLCLTA